MNQGLTLNLPEALIEAIADRVATIVKSEIGTTTTTATPYMTVAEAAEYLKRADHMLPLRDRSTSNRHDRAGGM